MFPSEKRCFQVDYWPFHNLHNYTGYLGVIEIGDRPRGISLRGELQLQLAVSTEAKPDLSSLNKLKCQLKVKNRLRSQKLIVTRVASSAVAYTVAFTYPIRSLNYLYNRCMCTYTKDSQKVKWWGFLTDSKTLAT